MADHWAVDLIGRPYEPMGRGPHTFDCWGLCVFVWKTHYGVEHIPDINCDARAPVQVRREFAHACADGIARQISTPIDGCAVYMSRARFPDHIGIYLDVDGGGVLHATSDGGVVFTHLRSLRFSGFSIRGFYALGQFP